MAHNHDGQANDLVFNNVCKFLCMCCVQSSTFRKFLNSCLVCKCFRNSPPSQCVRVNLVPRSGNGERVVSRQYLRGLLMSLATRCLRLIDRQVSTIAFMVAYECCAAQHYEHKWWNRELTLKCKLKCYVKPIKGPLGISPGKGNRGTTRGKEKIILTLVGIEPTTSGLDLRSPTSDLILWIRLWV